MTSDALERRVTKLENETLAIYDEINEFRRETASRFDAVDVRFDAVDTRLHAVETGVTEVLRRLPEQS